MPRKYWDDFDLGSKFRTASITVTETHIVNWASLTMDFYPLHMDESYASKTVFRGRVAHGPLILGMTIGLVSMTRLQDDLVVAFLGLNNMKMLKPVKIGDTITVEVEVIEKRETSKPDQGLQTWHYSVLNQLNEVVLVMDMTFLQHRKVA